MDGCLSLAAIAVDSHTLRVKCLQQTTVLLNLSIAERDFHYARSHELQCMI